MIRFDKMPVGCNWTIQYSDGQALTETYVGKISGGYSTRVTLAGNPGKVVRTMTYDAKGRLVRKDWANGKWETFTPHSCFQTNSSCTYRYRNADGADQKIGNSTIRNGKGFMVTAGPVGGAPFNDDYFEINGLGLMTRNKSANYSSRLIALNTCGAGS